MKTYTYNELQLKTIAELKEIKKEKLNELNQLRKMGFGLVANIIALQDMIKRETQSPNKR